MLHICLECLLWEPESGRPTPHWEFPGQTVLPSWFCRWYLLNDHDWALYSTVGGAVKWLALQDCWTGCRPWVWGPKSGKSVHWLSWSGEATSFALQMGKAIGCGSWVLSNTVSRTIGGAMHCALVRFPDQKARRSWVYFPSSMQWEEHLQDSKSLCLWYWLKPIQLAQAPWSNRVACFALEVSSALPPLRLS